MPTGVDGPEVTVDSVFGKWWFWGGLGALAGGSALAYVLLQHSEPPPPEHAAGTGGIRLRF